MAITVAHITPILALIGGIVILIAPRILAYHRRDLADHLRRARPVAEPSRRYAPRPDAP